MGMGMGLGTTKPILCGCTVVLVSQSKGLVFIIGLSAFQVGDRCL